MPSAPLRACSTPRCPGYAVRGSGRCERCREEWERGISRERGSAAARGYGANWRRLRVLVLHREPLCRECSAPATDVDHVLPRSRGGTDDPANLQALCKSCHSRKTMLEDGGYRGAAAGVR